jgi:LPS-assembly lipoprotein
MRLPAVALLLCLGACGWQLRGDVELPPALQTLHLESAQQPGPLHRRLARALSTAGVELVDGSGGTAYTLLLQEERLRSRAVSVDRAARSAERELSLSVRADLFDGEGTVVGEPIEVQASKIYRYDPNSIIAKEDEELRIRNELRDSLARQLLRALQSRRWPEEPEAT